MTTQPPTAADSDPLDIGGHLGHEAAARTSAPPPSPARDDEGEFATIIERAFRSYHFANNEDFGPDVLDAIATWRKDKDVGPAIEHLQTVCAFAAHDVAARRPAPSPPPPADRGARREAIAEAVQQGFLKRQTWEEVADAILALPPAPANGREG